jgi:hypothetical protein
VDVIVTPPPAVITVPRNVSRYGEPKRDVPSDAEHIAFLRDELRVAGREIAELRNLVACHASMLEAMVILNRRGEQPRTMDTDGTLLIPRLPLELRRERGGSLTVANHADGWLVRFRERLEMPTSEGA